MIEAEKKAGAAADRRDGNPSAESGTGAHAAGSGRRERNSGGTDVIVQGRMQTRAMKLVDISRLQELTGITSPIVAEIVLGAALTFNRITEHPSPANAIRYWFRPVTP